jgi:DtxR family Mn-dependent transcriptional regulator
VSPYGNPIPGLNELGVDAQSNAQPVVCSVAHLAQDDAKAVNARISRLAEPLQVDPAFLTQFASAGIRPGASASFARRDEYVRIEVEGADPAAALELKADVAAHIFVIP